METHVTPLARFARARLRQELGGPCAVPPDAPEWSEPGATFVTLRWPDGTLQGCIGTLEPCRSIVDDVAGNAIAAGRWDPRGRPLAARDVDALSVEVSVLSPLREVPVTSEAEALAAIATGEPGVVLGWRGRRATFLPVMWPRLGDPRTFLRELKAKAGLPRDFWAPDMELWTYSVECDSDEPPA